MTERFRRSRYAAAGEVSVTAMGVAGCELSATGKRTLMRVPVALESISSVPPSWRSLSRMPRMPTPGVPEEDISSLFGRDAFAFVRDLDKHFMVALTKADMGDRTSGMAMNIGEAFLYDAKNSGLGFTVQASEVLGEIQINMDFAADSESVDIPAKGRREAGFIE